MPGLFAALAAIWITIGAALSVVMGRRGHDPSWWFILGMFLGPLAIGLAVHTQRSRGPYEPEVLAEPVRGSGPVDVLVGFDGSPESRAAVDAATTLLGPRLGRMTLARVAPFYSGLEIDSDTKRSLQDEAELLRPLTVGLELVEGKPSTALSEVAAAAGFDLLVIGTRGAGLTSELLGSTAVELARHSKLPVLLVGAPEKEGQTDAGS